MFSCHDKNHELIQVSKSLTRHGDYSCIECGEQLILVKGKHYQVHFRHKINSGCSYSDELPEPVVAVEGEVSELKQLQDTLRIASLHHQEAKLAYQLAMVQEKLKH